MSPLLPALKIWICSPIARPAVSASRACKLRARRIGRIDEDRDAGHCGHQLAQQLQPLGHQLAEEKVDPRQVAAGPGEAGDEAQLDGVFGDRKHDRNSRGRRLGRDGRGGAAARDNDRDLSANQIGRHGRQPVELIVSPAVFDRNVRAFRIACVLQALVKGLQTVGEAGRRYGAEETDHRHRRLLRPRRKRPRAAAPPSSVMNSRRLMGSLPGLTAIT